MRCRQAEGELSINGLSNECTVLETLKGYSQEIFFSRPKASLSLIFQKKGCSGHSDCPPGMECHNRLHFLAGILCY